MQRTDTTHADQVSRLFGHDAQLRQTLGTERRPGHLAIAVGGRVVGAGRTLAAAIDAAQRSLAAEATK